MGELFVSCSFYQYVLHLMINFQDILGGGDNLDFYFSQQAVLGGVA